MRTARLAVALVACSLPLGWAPVAWSQGLAALPPDIVQTQTQLSEAQMTALRTFVTQHLPGLSGQPEQIMASRRALLEPLASASVPFRLRYATVLGPALTPLASGDKEMAAVNAVVIAGELASAESLEVLAAARASTLSSVRYQAAFGAVRLLESVARTQGPRALTDAQLRDLVQRIGADLRTERDVLVADAQLAALLAGVSIEGVRTAALTQLAEGVHERVRAAGETPMQGDVAEGYARTLAGLRDFLATAGSVPADQQRAAADIAGSVLWHASRAASALQQATPDVRKVYAQLAGSSESVILLAGQGLGSAPSERRLGDRLGEGTPQSDQQFSTQAQELLTALSSAPYNIQRPYR